MKKNAINKEQNDACICPEECDHSRPKTKILKVHSVNDYACYIGAPVLHPLVSVIHYDELEHCRHSLNNYDVYGIFIGDETLENLTYGLTTYDLRRHALMCVSPGQIGGKAGRCSLILSCFMVQTWNAVCLPLLSFLTTPARLF